MKTSIRKQSFGISNLTYQGGDFVHSLSGSNVTTEVVGRNVTLSIDLSKNDELGKEDHNHVIDVRELCDNFTDVDFVQLRKEKWFEDGLRQAFQTAKAPVLLWLEFVFKNRPARKTPVYLREDDGSLWLYLYQPSTLDPTQGDTFH